MSKNFVPLTLGLVEEGALLDDANRTLQEMATDLCEHVNHYGPDRTKGAEAILTLQVKLKYEGDGVYGIEGVQKTKMSGRPARWTKAIQVDEESGPTLLVRTSGSSIGNPHQLHLPLEKKAEEK